VPSLEPEPIQHKVYLAKWNVWITLLLCSDGPYIVIREFCGILGIVNTSDQIRKLRSRDATEPYVKKKPVYSPGGRQETYCLHQKAVGYWLGFSINPRHARLEVRASLAEIQQELLELAHRVIFGIVDSDAASAESKIIYLQDRLGPLPGASWPESDDDDE
jgi:hypothetical protein